MTELSLYKFITENSIEYHYSNDRKDIHAFIPIWNLKDWNILLGTRITSEDALECHLKGDYLCFEMIAICEYFNIDHKNVFKEEN